jgi:choline dehydrogenase
LVGYFRRSERVAGRDSALRGTDGPVVVEAVAHPLAVAGVDAATEAGFSLTDDIGGGLETGFGWSDLNLVGGVRQSAADGYLRPFLSRPKLTVVTNAVVQ